MDRCLILILIVGTGLVTGDNIEPDKGTEKNSKETETVELSCSYSTSSENVYALLVQTVSKQRTAVFITQRCTILE
ncbi:hypothetical protein PO909_031142 [Leuciscus waleckii]